MLGKARMTVFLKNPVVDKIMGLFVILPSAYVLYLYALQVEYRRFDWYHLAIAANLLVLISTTLFRRTAVRISLNPFYWVVTLLRTYWSFIILTYVYAYALPP